MLEHFFKLNSPFTVFQTERELVGRLLNSNDLRDVLFQPNKLGPPNTTRPNNPYTGKTFANVSFSKTIISGVTFRDCAFEDCLFIGTRFENCEFRHCTFRGCNPHKMVFAGTHIDPSVFEGMLDPVKHSNIGMDLFQQLYNNSREQNQPEFANTAEFNRNKWSRYVLNRRYNGAKTTPQYIVPWLSNFLFYILAGYGIRSKFLAAWAFIVIAGSIVVNFLFWDFLGVVEKDGTAATGEFVDVLYYTATIPAGVGDFTPTSQVGKLIFLGEIFIGLTLFALFATWLVKRTLR